MRIQFILEIYVYRQKLLLPPPSTPVTVSLADEKELSHRI